MNGLFQSYLIACGEVGELALESSVRLDTGAGASGSVEATP